MQQTFEDALDELLYRYREIPDEEIITALAFAIDDLEKDKLDVD